MDTDEPNPQIENLPIDNLLLENSPPIDPSSQIEQSEGFAFNYDIMPEKEFHRRLPASINIIGEYSITNFPPVYYNNYVPNIPIMDEPSTSKLNAESNSNELLPTAIIPIVVKTTPKKGTN